MTDSLLIVGGGVGGLTAALCLADVGMQVQVFETTSTSDDPGAGLQLSPNASRVLHHLGLGPDIASVAFRPRAVEFRHWRSGKTIAETPLGDDARRRFGAPYYHIHRGDLIDVLSAAALRDPQITVRPGVTVRGFSSGGMGQEARVEITTTAGPFRGDLLIGADGIHSGLRSQLLGDVQVRFTGNVAWRALVRASDLPDHLVRPSATAWWGPGKHFVHYFVRQGAFVNCVCVVEKSGWDVESWTERGDWRELKSDFAGWHTDLQQLIDAMDRETLYKWALHDHAPLPYWGRGPVSLLGDACHATLPFMAQGAAMAIEDAAVLAGCMTGGTDRVQGLRRYEALRQPRAAWVQSASRRNASVFHLRGPGAWLRNRVAGFASARTMNRLYSYDALTAADADP